MGLSRIFTGGALLVWIVLPVLFHSMCISAFTPQHNPLRRPFESSRCPFHMLSHLGSSRRATTTTTPTVCWSTKRRPSQSSSPPSSPSSKSYANFWNSLGGNGSSDKKKRGTTPASPASFEQPWSGMGDLVKSLQTQKKNDNKNDRTVATKKLNQTDNDNNGNNVMDRETLLYGVGALVAAAGVGFCASLGLGPADLLHATERFLQNPQDTLQDVVEGVQAMGPAGPLYFGIIYLVAEILAVPATPLTLSAGYLFGLTQGVGVVLLAATIAASISFYLGETFLRSYVEEALQDNPKFAKIDKAIARDGFKLLLLVRLSPIFPFALSNYLYGASAIDFASYFWGTLLGFAPGTFAYVYTGMVGKALTLGEGEPWYVYAGGFALLLAFLKVVTDVATNIVDAIDEDE